MSAWWSGSVRSFLDLDDVTILGVLSHQQSRRYRGNEPKQVWAWKAELPLLRDALRDTPDPEAWRVLLEFDIPRLGGRLDAVLLSSRAIFAIEFKIGATRIANAACARLHGYALDLQDFCGGSRNRPILPILVATTSSPNAVALLLLVGGAAAIVKTNASGSRVCFDSSQRLLLRYDLSGPNSFAVVGVLLSLEGGLDAHR